MPPATVVPITVLTGFLGAGKTTVLNAVLRAPSGRRLAVLVNDFGAVNIDAELIAEAGEETIALENGCICCTMRDDLVGTLMELLHREDPPEHILVEASGVADPHAIAGTFRLPTLRGLIEVDAVAAVVALNEQRWRGTDRNGDFVRQQLAAANLVLASKGDMLTAEERAAMLAEVTATVPHASVIEVTPEAVPVPLLLGAAGSRPAVPVGPSEPTAAPPAFTSWTVRRAEGFVSLPALQQALKQVPAGVLRLKGYAWVHAMPARRIRVNRVGSRIDFAPGAEWGADVPQTHLVLIAAGDREATVTVAEQSRRALEGRAGAEEGKATSRATR